MSGLLAHALYFLRSHFPNTLHAWFNNQTYVPAGWEHAHAIGVVNIAWLTRCKPLLPTALLACCALDDTQLDAGFLREDGSRERLDEHDGRKGPAGSFGARLDSHSQTGRWNDPNIQA